jgi:hypothetical protein
MSYIRERRKRSLRGCGMGYWGSAFEAMGKKRSGEALSGRDKMEEQYSTPRELVKSLLRPQVERGDDLEFINQSFGGYSCGEHHVVRCYLWWDDDWQYYPERQPRKKLTRWQVGVERFGGEPCVHVYSVPELVAEIAAEIKHGRIEQMELFVG